MQLDTLLSVLSDQIGTITAVSTFFDAKLLKARAQDLSGQDKAHISSCIRKELRSMRKNVDKVPEYRCNVHIPRLVQAHLNNLEQAEKRQFINDRLELEQLPALQGFDAYIQDLFKEIPSEQITSRQEAVRIAEFRNACNSWRFPLAKAMQCFKCQNHYVGEHQC
jgi:hypothetical protein